MNNVHKKLMIARLKLQQTSLKKSGRNKFAGYEYFELGDFLPVVQDIFGQEGLCGTVSFTSDLATLTITNIDEPTQTVLFTSPMSSAALKGCHEVQNLGAVHTYLRRYLWVNALEIVEHDALDATMGKDDPSKKAEPTTESPRIVGKVNWWQISAPGKPEGDPTEWMKLIKEGSLIALGYATKPKDVNDIFQNNKALFDVVKATDQIFFQELMASFKEAKEKIEKENVNVNN